MAYWSAGWTGVLPLPAGRKWPPPPGWTGYDGEYPSRADVQTWLDDPRYAVGNVALRLPREVLGLDVDAYPGKAGGTTLARLTATLGPLPATWSTTARDDGVSGIRLYRVPGSALESNWKGEAGPGIEVIQWGHRYAIAPPSRNPDAGGAPYRWWALDSGRCAVTKMPRPDELPELPARWVGFLSHGYDRRTGVELDDDAARGWLDRCRALTAGEAGCSIVERTAAVQLGVGSRHEAARDAVHALVRLGGEGHAGVWAALVGLRGRFVEALAGQRGRDAGGEWRRMLSGAVRLAAASDPVPRNGCDCAVWSGEGVGFDPGFPGEGGSTGEGVQVVEATGEPRRFEPLDWPVEFERDFSVVDWMAGRLFERGQQVALVGEGKSGKSLLAFDLAVHAATGRTFLGGPELEPVHVVYVDRENSRRDLVQRAVALGYQPADLKRLIYYSFPPLPWLDEDASELLGLAAEHAAELVVVDTVSRFVQGKENDSDTWLNLYRRLHVALKRDGRAGLRLDHFGKDTERGARGSSAKTQDIDHVWELSVLSTDRADRLSRTALRLTRTHTRTGIGEDVFDLVRVGLKDAAGEQWVAGSTAHELADERHKVWAGEGVREIAARLDEAGVERFAGREKCRTAGLKLGIRQSNEMWAHVVRYRKEQHRGMLAPPSVGFDPGEMDEPA